HGVGVMDAAWAAGDRAGPIQQGRFSELLVEKELDLPPDKDVLAFAERLRLSAAETSSIVETAPSAPPTPLALEPLAEPAIVPVAATVPEAPTTQPVAVAPSHQAPPAVPESARPLVASPRRMPSIPRWAIAASVLVVAAASAVAFARWTSGKGGVAAGNAVVAIGNITAYGADSAGGTLTAPVADLLTTSLARVHSIRVVSHGRMLELLHASGKGDTSTGAFLDAARQAGATQMIDGTLYARPG